MGRIARETVERAGIDVDVLVNRLMTLARAELAACYRCTILCVPSTDVDDGLREILRDVRAEDRNHFDVLVTRIHELDARVPVDIRLFVADVSDEDVPAVPGEGLRSLVKVLIECEKRAVLAYGRLCEFTRGKDHRTYEIAHAILNEEIEHEKWFRELLGTGRPSRFHRGFRGRSPYLERLPPSDLDPG
ncbi:ferritin-like domain-containing protein [Actinomadura rubrisoli]|uniref:DNA protection protein DPS n=1 Tax=Actinomadura rubrisoli TaxID=2530368 RepID=A0A4R5C395_9ACTN|nr:ferritin-like domain-containing protein [Actinomadura rubrisoli]TDD94131.1 DNA protection protein DPS [Actinomadura rubrisoli]